MFDIKGKTEFNLISLLVKMQSVTNVSTYTLWGLYATQSRVTEREIADIVEITLNPFLKCITNDYSNNWIEGNNDTVYDLVRLKCVVSAIYECFTSYGDSITLQVISTAIYKELLLSMILHAFSSLLPNGREDEFNQKHIFAIEGCLQTILKTHYALIAPEVSDFLGLYYQLSKNGTLCWEAGFGASLATTIRNKISQLHAEDITEITHKLKETTDMYDDANRLQNHPLYITARAN